jgi:ABC-type methionine transport system permease subunit
VITSKSQDRTLEQKRGNKARQGWLISVTWAAMQTKSKLMDGSDDVRAVQGVVLGALIIISSIPPCMQHAMPVWILNPLICEATSLVPVVLLLVLKHVCTELE